MAVDARQHKRLEEAYIEMLQLVGRVHHWATRVYPLMETDPPQPEPDLPSPDEQVRVQALASAYGSAPVRVLFDEFRARVQDVTVAAETIAFAEAHSSHSHGEMAREYRIKLDGELRPAILAKRRELEAHVAEELRGRSGSV